MWIKPDFDGILPELKSVDNWVLAKAVVRDGKATKPPYHPEGYAASHSNPETWSSFAAVKKAYERGGYIGVGYVLDGKPHFGGRYLHGFDWDHCIEDGVLDPTVAAAIAKLGMPRTETSVSGTGIRGFFLHDELLQSRRTHIEGRSVELYSTTRYLTTTGVGEGGVVMSVNIAALLDLFPASKVVSERSRAAPSEGDEETWGDTIRGSIPFDSVMASKPDAFSPDLVDAVTTVRSNPRGARLFAGDLSDYDGDHSKGDLALCGAFARLGLASGGIDTAMRTSGLYREKWERDDYRKRTLAMAVGTKPAEKPPVSLGLLAPANGKITISTDEPRPRDYTLQGLLLPSKSAVLAGFGGVSKTQLGNYPPLF
jgi:primase-polymerase (primpol)-like protein